MSQILRSFNAVIDDVDTEKREVVAKVSVGDIDRHRTIIESRGISLDSYRQNPVVLFEHGKDPTRGAMPVGRCLWIRPDNVGNGRILAKTRFATDPFSQMLLEFYRDGTMRGWSIMILPKEASPPSRDEIRSRSELADCELIYRESDLGEYSAVSVPSCASALSMPELRSLSKLVVGGFWTPTEEVKTLVEPIVERMSESNGMANGGALVDDDDDDEKSEPDGDEDDDKLKKKKKKKKVRDTDEESDEVEMCMDAKEKRSVEDSGSDGLEPESVERTAIESKTVESVVEEFIESVKEVESDQVIEDPRDSLPPLVGRSFEEILKEAMTSIDKFQEVQTQKIKDLAGWFDGKA